MRLRTLLLIPILLLGPLASPAMAHDQLIDIDPKAGAELTSGEFEVVMTFNNPLLEVEGGENAELETQLVGSETWISHPVEIDREIARAKVSLSEPGEYLLRWKVVSSDGHPISGESNFVLNLETQTEEPAEEEPILIAPNPTETDQSSGSLTGFYVGLALVALGAIFAPIGLMMRRKAKKS